MQYKAVFFDYDGVLTTDKTGSFTTNRYLSQIYDIDINILNNAFRPYNDDLLSGKKSHEYIWEEVCGKIGKKMDIRKLISAFESTPLNHEMVDLVTKINGRYKTGIITENKKDRMKHLVTYQNLNEIFDVIVVSAEVGFNKKQTEIFEYAIQKIGVIAEESIFIDNTKENLIAADQIGMKTIYHDDSENNVKRIEKYLIKCKMEI